MSKRGVRRLNEHAQFHKIANGLNKLERTLIFQEGLCGTQNCPCLVCRTKRDPRLQPKTEQFKQSSEESHKWLYKIINGLCTKDALSLKIYVPDLCFVEGDILHVFYTDIRDNRIKKMDGTAPTKSLYLTMLRLKKLYKQMLENNFQKAILNEIDPQFVHEKYLEHILPSHFNDSHASDRLHNNKEKFMKYVLHKDKKMLIQSIEEHKLNENEPFCTVRFADGNMQLFSKKEFEHFTLLKVSSDVVFVQAYIKQRQEQKAHFTSCYSFTSNQTDMELFDRAEREVMVLIGGVSKYSESYVDLEVYQDSTIEMMKTEVEKYVKYMTYKIVHYLAMVSRIYVKHIKINWILNDLRMVYLQSIFEFETTDISLRIPKYRLPPKEDNIMFYKDSQNFINLYKQTQMLREARRIKIRSDIMQQIESSKLDLASTIDQSYSAAKFKGSRSVEKRIRLSKTIVTRSRQEVSDVAGSLDKTKLNRYVKDNNQKVSFFEKKRKERRLSLLQKYPI